MTFTLETCGQYSDSHFLQRIKADSVQPFSWWFPVISSAGKVDHVGSLIPSLRYKTSKHP